MNSKLKIKITGVAMFLIISGTWLNAQNEFSKWIFGFNAGLDFSTSPPTVFTNPSSFNSFGDVATISDNAGNIRFFTDGGAVYNSSYSVMSNGSGLSPMAALEVAKKPGSNDIFYIFTGASFTWLKYSVIDLSLSAGMGSVTSMNTNLYQPTCTRLVTARHCNGKDVWVISHDFGSNQFRAYLLNSSGLSANPVLSNAGPSASGNPSTGVGSGQMQMSPNGKLLALAQYTDAVPSTSGTAGFYLLDFDAATGILSNARQIANIPAAATVEFSGDGKKFFGATVTTPTYTNSVLYQWDICAGTTSAITATQYSVSLGYYATGGLRRAIDGKIYLNYTPQVTAFSYSIGVINNPTGSGAAINFLQYGQSVGAKMPGGSFPNYINPYVKPVISFTPNANCQHVSFTGPAPSFTGGCNPNAYPINGYLWDFGEPAAGAANTSTVLSPSHSYSSTGTYSVKLIVFSNCTNDTIVQTVNVTNLMPSISVSGNSVICKGENRTYTATGASTYSWSGSTSTTSVASLSPASTTVYTVTGFANGCSTTNTFSVKVNDCQGLSEVAKDKVVAMYPNPFGNSLNVDMEEAMPYYIYSLDGKLVLKGQLVKGHNELNTENLKPGLYIAECGKGENSVRFRVVKAE